jgi:translation initiation factor IF-1
MLSLILSAIMMLVSNISDIPSVSAKDAGGSHDDRRIQEVPNRPSAMKTVRGRVVKSEDSSVTVEQVNGEETVLTIDTQTKLNKKKLRPGDRITATVTPEGRAAVILKAGKPKP